MNLTISQSENFYLSQPELLFMLRLLELPDLPGMGEKPWGDITLDAAQEKFCNAGLALKEHGLVAVDENRHAMVNAKLQEVLEASTYPDRMMQFKYKKPGEDAMQISYYRRGASDVRHLQTGDHLHEFNLSNQSDMGLQELVTFFGSFSCDFITPIYKISSQSFEEFIDGCENLSKSMENNLIEAGIPASVTAKMAQTFERSEIKAQIQWVYELNPDINYSSVFIWIEKSNCFVAETSQEQRGGEIKVMALNIDLLMKLIASAHQQLFS